MVLVPAGVGHKNNEWMKLYREFSPGLRLQTVMTATAVAAIFLILRHVLSASHGNVAGSREQQVGGGGEVMAVFRVMKISE